MKKRNFALFTVMIVLITMCSSSIVFASDEERQTSLGEKEFQLVLPPAPESEECVHLAPWEKKHLAKIKSVIQHMRKDLQKLQAHIAEEESLTESFCDGKSMPMLEYLIYQNKMLFNQNLERAQNYLKINHIPMSLLYGTGAEVKALEKYEPVPPADFGMWNSSCDNLPPNVCLGIYTTYMSWFWHQIKAVEFGCRVNDSELLTRLIEINKGLFDSAVIDYDKFAKYNGLKPMVKFQKFFSDTDASSDVQ